MMKSFFAAVVLCALVFAGNATAEPTTPRTIITGIRPYNVTSGSGVVYVTTSVSLSPCNTNVYRIELGYPGGKEMYAAALAAMLAGYEVALEIANTGCGSATGAALQSINVYTPGH